MTSCVFLRQQNQQSIRYTCRKVHVNPLTTQGDISPPITLGVIPRVPLTTADILSLLRFLRHHHFVRRSRAAPAKLIRDTRRKMPIHRPITPGGIHPSITRVSITSGEYPSITAGDVRLPITPEDMHKISRAYDKLPYRCAKKHHYTAGTYYTINYK